MPCDVFLAPHAGFFNLDEKRKQLEAGKVDAFVDSREMKKFVEESARTFHEQLEKERSVTRSLGQD